MLPTAPILALVLMTAGTTSVGAGTTWSQLSPANQLERSYSVMTNLHSVHASGTFNESEVEPADLRSKGSWSLMGDCLKIGSTTLLRFTMHGHETGKHPRRVNEDLVARIPKRVPAFALWLSRWSLWTRTVGPGGGWQRPASTHDAQIASAACPWLSNLIAPLPSLVRRLPSVKLSGHSALHLQVVLEGRGGGGSNDFYLDTHTLRWLKARFFGWGPGCCHSQTSTFLYSRYNVPMKITLP